MSVETISLNSQIARHTTELSVLNRSIAMISFQCHCQDSIHVSIADTIKNLGSDLSLDLRLEFVRFAGESLIFWLICLILW